METQNLEETEPRTVWVTNSFHHEFAKATTFGELKYLTKGYVSFQSLDKLKILLATEISQTNEEDYLLLAGATILCVIAALEWFQIHGKIKLLNWDRKADNGNGDYRLLTITSANLTELLNVMRSDARI